VLVASCGSGEKALLVKPKSPVSVKFACDGVNTDGVNTVSLIAEGRTGWVVETDANKKLRWEVDQNVTIDSIFPKRGQQLPVEPDGPDQGGAPGKAYKTKVKSGVQSGNTRYPYSIALTCQPSGPESTPIKLLIDPEMIVR
jgi:hypothetical protein